MEFTFVHSNINVMEIDRSIAFYQEALGLKVMTRKEGPDGRFILAFVGNTNSPALIELTWLRDKKEPYELGDNESHLAFTVDDYEAAHARHQKMGCICCENEEMGLYFIEDPDGYWIEIIPKR
ncbi:MAG TPA: VOC family protein [Bacillota bacterium]|nr:VOC family protein [Bacillota bacterium]